MQFVKNKYSGLDGRTYVAHCLVNKELQAPLKMTASPSGLSLSGVLPEMEAQEDLQAFAKALSDAWSDHVMLRKDILQRLGGQS